MAHQSWDPEVQQAGSGAAANVLDSLLHQFRRTARVKSTAAQGQQVTKRSQILGDISFRDLQISGNREAVSVVFNEEEHGKLQGGSHGQRRPEAICRNGAVAPKCDPDRSLPVVFT